MAYIIPVSPCTGCATYAEIDAQFEDVTGTSAGLITTVVGQRLARAADAAYWQILNCLLSRGYTVAQITSWFAGEGHAVHQYLSVYWWASDSGVARDHAVFADADRYKLRWEEICLHGAAIFDNGGTVLTPDPSSAAADALQGEHSVQNNTLSENHLFRFDADPRQFAGSDASHIAAGTKYRNPY